jgi:hypothetical protein
MCIGAVFTRNGILSGIALRFVSTIVKYYCCICCLFFFLKVDDEDLQDEPLQIRFCHSNFIVRFFWNTSVLLRVLDHDTYSAHDAIGKVYIDLNPLLTKERTMVINGWFPIFDTMHGMC